MSSTVNLNRQIRISAVCPNCQTFSLSICFILIIIPILPIFNIVTCKPFNIQQSQPQQQQEQNSQEPKEDKDKDPQPAGTYFYSNFKLPSKILPKKLFLPVPHSCPETGDTICSDIDQYPSETILDIVNHAKTSNFNFSSIFVDESINDIEPRMDNLIYHSIKTIDKGPKQQQQQQPQPQQSRVNLGQRMINQSYSANLRNKMNNSPISRQLAKNANEDNNNSTSSSNNNSTNFDDQQNPRTKRKSQQEMANNPQQQSKSKAPLYEVEELCQFTSRYVEPRVALNDRAEWKFIVNLGDHDPRLRQIIRAELCVHANKPCSSKISLPFGFKTRCKQKYIKKKLLALDASGLTTSAENFFVPSCCSCEILREYGAKAR
ncbi:uncharacterized protein LOC141856735 isoform X2 [Brevipalpus obovatus]|uniref:uncharacterized protein LOC141856735 isoform X2 n=1 Tax=Brevipalpus obovatus TaxID=246614 RepID=UPI003D9F6C00